MKKSIIIILIACFITALIGIIFIAVGVRYDRRLSKRIVYSDSQNSVEKTFIVDEAIDEVYIESKALAVEIVYDNVKQIEIKISDFYSEDDIDVSYSNKKLNIEALKTPEIFYKKRNIHRKHPRVLISIPNDTVFNVFSIENKASNMNIYYIDAKRINIENDAANIDIKKLNAEYLSLENNGGNISVSSILGANNIKIENKVGNVHMFMEEDPNCSVSIKNNVGKVSVFGKSYKGIRVEKPQAGKFEKNIDIENNVGRVIIQ